MNNRKKPTQQSASPYLRLTSAGLQMAGVIVFFTYSGYYIDQLYAFQEPWFTIVLGLFGVAVGLYLIIREVIQINKNNHE
ncbi:MAG: AtpZ/AtpI family protein [Flavobacteriales bacterium]